MDAFSEIRPEELNINPFSLIGRDWMLIAARSGGRVNAMTASWGALGVLWGRPAAFIFIRKSRFTKTLVDGASGFSLSFFDREKYASALSYMGRVSGRDEDKIAACGFDVLDDGAPYFAQAETVMLCGKLCRVPIGPESFEADWIDARHYPTGDYHDMYVGGIEKILKKVNI